MLLESKGRVKQTFTRLCGDENGGALLVVLGIMGVTIILGLTISVASLHALGFTTSTRAGVEAEAAAEAGVDFVAANLATSNCQPQYLSNISPKYVVSVSYSNVQSPSGYTDTSWVLGCPTSTSAQRVKLISIGWATNLGVAGNSSQDMRRVEAIYSYTPSSPVSSILPSGPAAYSYAQIDPTINNLTITQAGAVKPTMIYVSGSATCTSDSQITADVVMGAGDFSMTSGCLINGNLSTSGVVSVQSGEVTGSVIAAGVQKGTSVSLGTTGRVDGNIYSTGPVSISGIVGGNIVSGPTPGSSTFSSKSSVGGSVISAGTVSAPTGVIKGTTSQNQSGVVTPVIPLAPPWVDFAYDPANWIAASGSPYAVLTMTTCGSTQMSSYLTSAQNSAVPVILDTRACGSITDFSGYNMTLTSDTVIIANGFKFQGNQIQARSAPAKRLWIIIPDQVADNQPTCPKKSSATLGNGVVMGPNVVVMYYSPCPVNTGADTITGQIYASSISTSGNFILNFLQIGLPTVNLSTGQPVVSTGSAVLGDRISIRDLVSS